MINLGLLFGESCSLASCAALRAFAPEDHWCQSQRHRPRWLAAIPNLPLIVRARRHVIEVWISMLNCIPRTFVINAVRF